MEFNDFEVLQDWYYLQCDEDWEHEFGIKIDTLDNPGWLVVIDLNETYLENKIFEDVECHQSEHDWFSCKVEGVKFKGSGGPKNLSDIIRIFVRWASYESYSNR